MSKVIKYAVFQEKPHTIEMPAPSPEPETEAGEEPGLDEEAVASLMAEIRAKEDKARKLLEEAEAESERLKQETRTECEQMLKEAGGQAAAMKEEARAKGYDEGVEHGRQEGEAQIRREMADFVKQTNAQAEKTLRDAKDATRDYVQQAEADIVGIAMSVVEKVLPQHFIDVPQVVLPLVREAILKVCEQKEIIVHVPPDNYDFVLMARDELRSVLTAGDAVLEIHSDEALKPGDCLVETPNGSVDARLAVQLQLLEQAVRDVMM